MPTITDGSRSRRTVLKSLGGLSVAGSLAGCLGSLDGSGSKSGGKPKYNAKMGIVAYELNQIPSVTAFHEMLPDATNDRMKGSVRTFKGSPLAMQALAAGAIDYYALSPGNVIQAQLAGQDPRILATKIKGTDYAFVVQKNINSLDQIAKQDLSVGIAGLGGLSHMQVAGVFQKEGYDPKKDVNIQEVGGSSTRASAVVSGKIDATVIHNDQWHQIKSQGFDGKKLFDLKKYYPNFVSQSIAVPGKYLDDETKNAHVKAYMEQFVKANKKATESFDWTYKHAKNYQSKSLNEEDAKTSWKLNAKEIDAWPHTKKAYRKQDYQNQVDILVAAGVMSKKDAKNVDLDKLLDLDIYGSAVKNL